MDQLRARVRTTAVDRSIGLLLAVLVLLALFGACSGSETDGGGPGASGPGGSTSTGSGSSSSSSSSGYDTCAELGCDYPGWGCCHCEALSDCSACTACAYDDHTACAHPRIAASRYPDFNAFTNCMEACSNQYLCPPNTPCATACEVQYPEMAALVRNYMQCAFCDMCGPACSLTAPPCYLYYCAVGQGGGGSGAGGSSGVGGANIGAAGAGTGGTGAAGGAGGT